MRALGVDVSERRGLDLVLLDGSARPRVKHCPEPADLAAVLREWTPDVVAIDSPPAWSTAGASRQCERDLSRLGIQAFYTPDRGKSGHPFYRWMAVGIEAHRTCHESGFPPYQGGNVQGHTLEVFPHASAVSLAGRLPARETRKHAFRVAVLEAHGIERAPLASLDLVDAALCALTGLFALRGEYTALGETGDGLIVVPGRALPSRPFTRPGPQPEAEGQAYLPSLRPCACGERGCRERTSGEFAPGHDAKRKSLLWKRALEGQEALAELDRRGWERPPELRQR